MITVGIAFGYHDSSVAVIKDEEILGIYAEERFSRLKHDKSFPTQAIKYAIKKHQITERNLEAIVYYEDPALKLSRIRSQCRNGVELARLIAGKQDIPSFINPLEKISKELGIGIEKLYISKHHTSHLFNSLAQSSWVKNNSAQKALAITLDGVGEKQTGGIYSLNKRNEKIEVEEIKRYEFPNSIGLFYSAITSFLGFEVNDAEFKVMGLASYGKPTYIKQMNEIISLEKDGTIRINPNYLNFSPSAPFPFKPQIIKILGQPARNSKEYAEHFTTIQKVGEDKELKRYADIAASTQKHIVNIITNIANRYNDNNSHEAIIYSGGVALNCKCNNELGQINDLGISPDPGDGGNALGAAVAYINEHRGKMIKLTSPYLGHDIAHKEDDQQANEPRISPDTTFRNELEKIEYAVDLLAQNKVIGWAQGRAEFGPRALGNRSIIANPSDINAKEFVNIAVKYREPFRPFAPAVLEEYLEDLFDINDMKINMSKLNPLNLMLVAVKAKKQALDLMPACVHVDGTSRVQVVNKKTNPLFYNLIQKFYEQTGIPGVLNTSFNLRGEPIVNNLNDCLRTFEASNMHALIAADNLYKKTND